MEESVRHGPSEVEQARGDEVGFAADQYAAGLLIYKMLSGRLPFQSKTPRGFWALHASEPPVDIRALVDIPAGLGAAVMRSLAKRPSERFPDVAAFEKVLAGYVRRGREKV